MSALVILWILGDVAPDPGSRSAPGDGASVALVVAAAVALLAVATTVIVVAFRKRRPPS